MYVTGVYVMVPLFCGEVPASGFFLHFTDVFCLFFFFLEQVTLICGEVRASFIFLFYISQLYFCFVGYFFFSAAVMVVCRDVL